MPNYELSINNFFYLGHDEIIEQVLFDFLPVQKYCVKLSLYVDEEMERDLTQGIKIEKVGVYGDKILIRWDDGHESTYGAREIRISCQCAECVEEWSKRQLLDPASVPSDLVAEDHLMIGNYAIQFLWSDAHYTGIFPFDTLRTMCPCSSCN